jgi:Na+/H+ antiporter NhaD/arsenite permease-like protein
MRILLGALISAFATPTHAASLDGAAMSWPWALPFAGLLLTIAAGPTLFAKLWHAHYGKIAALWAALALLPLAAVYGVTTAAEQLTHALLGEFLSFIVLLFALYTVAGGIVVSGSLRGTPLMNGAMLALGTSIASIVGTTGAAMILIRPVIRANRQRRHRAHVIVFFIILVANVGGALTPLGDPPLFVGFLHGVDFFWTARHLWMQTAIVAVLVLCMFLAVDWLLYRGEPVREATAADDEPIRVRGKINFALIALIIGAILLSATWKPGVSFSLLGTRVELQNLARDGTLVLIALASLWLTPDEHRAANGFTWEPIREVAKLFAAIFVAITRCSRCCTRAATASSPSCSRRSRRTTASRIRSPISGSPACSRRSSTMHRPTWCSSSSPAATRAR